MSPDPEGGRGASAQRYEDLVRTDPAAAAAFVRWLQDQLNLLVGETVPSPHAPKQERLRFEERVRDLSQRLRPGRVPIGRLR